MASKVLVVDDEELIVKGIKFSLEQDGMVVDTAYEGDTAVEKIKSNNYDIVLLDVMLPGKNGLEVLSEVRVFSSVPVIMVTAKSDDIDKIMGLEYGADDYITKPFNILVVKAKIKALMRRSQKKQEIIVSNDHTIAKGDLIMDTEARNVAVNGRDVNLTAKEFDLLELLLTNPNKVYSRENLLSIVWGYDYPGDIRTVDVHVRRLREKIEPNPGDPKYVHTKWGIGYYYKE